jgi:hypothetical protein
VPIRQTLQRKVQGLNLRVLSHSDLASLRHYQFGQPSSVAEGTCTLRKPVFEAGVSANCTTATRNCILSVLFCQAELA